MPPYLQWEVTPRCNHNCIHCYNYWRSKGEKIEESKLYHHIAKKIVEAHPASVVITGGEPLLVFDEIKPELLYLVNNGVCVSLNTNASLVNDDIALFLKNNNISVFVSLPCSDEKICNKITNTKNAFLRTSNGIKILVRNGVRVTVNMVVMKCNIDYIYETAKYCIRKLGIDSFFASRVGKPINSNSSFDIELLNLSDFIRIQRELLKIKNDFGVRVGTAGPVPACSIENETSFQMFAYKKNCSAGKTSYGIDTNGNVKACPRDNKIYGNILEESFEEIWNKMSEWRDESLLPIECKKCSVKKQCGGGCRLDAYPFTNKRDQLDMMVNLNNLPIKYLKKLNNTDINVDVDDKLFVPKSLKFLKEDFGWRVNNFGKIMYITDEMKNFLVNNSNFTISSFALSNNLDIDIAKFIVMQLLKNNIIFTQNMYSKLNFEEVKQ